MKKILLLIFMVLAAQFSYAGFYDSNFFAGKDKAYADQMFDPFARLMAQTLNSGLGDPMNIKTFKAGGEIVFTKFDKSGFLGSSPVSVLPVPYLYGGLSFFDIVAFGRISVLPVSSGGKLPSIIGGGLGMKFDFTPLFTFTPALTYHQTQNLEFIDVYSFGAQAQFRINLLVFTPYANAGVSYTKFNTDLTLSDSSKYKTSKTLFHTSVGAKLFFFFGEVAFLPERSVTVGMSLGF